MKRIQQAGPLIILAAAALLLAPGRAGASGIGFYVSPGGGRFTYNDRTMLGTGDPFKETLFIAGGLISDTNLAGEDIFSYRNKIGVAWVGSGLKPVRSLFRFTLDNIFGFRLMSSDTFRAWIGPFIGFSYVAGKRHFIELRSYSGNIVPVRTGSRYSLGGIDFGLALGWNLNISRYLTVAVDAGFRYNLYFNFLQEEEFSSGISGTVGLVGVEGFASVAFMYRGRLVIN